MSVFYQILYPPLFGRFTLFPLGLLNPLMSLTSTCHLALHCGVGWGLPTAVMYWHCEYGRSASSTFFSDCCSACWEHGHSFLPSLVVPIGDMTTCKMDVKPTSLRCFQGHVVLCRPCRPVWVFYLHLIPGFHSTNE